MSWGALKQELLADSHSMVSVTDCDRKIMAAIRFHRQKRLWFSERKFQSPLTAGVAEYSPGNVLPSDLVEIVGRRLWVLIGGSDSQRWPVERVTSDEFDMLKAPGSTVTSQPMWWDYFGNRLRLYPVPSNSVDVLEGRYVRDIGVPQPKYEGGAWKIYDPTGTQQWTQAQLDALDNDWTNPNGAYHMIRSRAMYELCKDVIHDDERAQQALSTWLEQVAVLEDETEAKTAGATVIQGTILGEAGPWGSLW